MRGECFCRAIISQAHKTQQQIGCQGTRSWWTQTITGWLPSGFEKFVTISTFSQVSIFLPASSTINWRGIAHRGRDHRALGNAYALDWSRELAWANSPFSEMAQMLDKIVQDQATVLVCLPMWTSQPWWGKLQSMRLGPPSLSEGWGYFVALKEILYPHQLGQLFSWLPEADWC